MATIGNTVLTLADVAKLKDPNGSIADIAEILMQTNEMLADAPIVEGNMDTGNRSVIRTGHPTPSLRRLNEGVSATKSTTAQVEDGCSIVEDWSDLDVDMPAGGHLGAVRIEEARTHIEGIGQFVAEEIIYGSVADDEREFNGFATRYSSTSGNVADNMISGGGASGQTDCTSIWLIGWAPNKIFLTHPKGSKAGLIHEDLGQQTVQTSTTLGSTRLRVWQDRFQWQVGLVVKDWRYAVRIHSIDMSALAADPTGATVTLISYMIKALHRIPMLSSCRPVFYVTRSVHENFDIQALNKALYQIKTDNPGGDFQMRFRGVPIKIHDQIVHTETSLN